MALKAVVEILDEVPEALREEYTEADGRYILDVEAVDGFALEDVKGLKNALSRQQADAKRFKDQLKAFGDMSPDEAKKAAERLAELEELTNSKGDVEARIKDGIKNREDQLVTKYKKELDEKDSRISHLTGKLEGALVDSRAAEAIREAKGSVELLLPHVKRYVRMNEVDGQFVAQVVDDQDNPRISLKSNSTDPMSIQELVKEMSGKDTYAPAFAGSGASGGGVAGTRGGGSPSGTGKFTLTSEQARDTATYRRAREAAAKEGQTVTITD
jgi:polyhydroxyalkanoate synthesis regulator phasin